MIGDKGQDCCTWEFEVLVGGVVEVSLVFNVESDGLVCFTPVFLL